MTVPSPQWMTPNTRYTHPNSFPDSLPFPFLFRGISRVFYMIHTIHDKWHHNMVTNEKYTIQYILVEWYGNKWWKCFVFCDVRLLMSYYKPYLAFDLFRQDSLMNLDGINQMLSKVCNNSWAISRHKTQSTFTIYYHIILLVYIVLYISRLLPCYGVTYHV